MTTMQAILLASALTVFSGGAAIAGDKKASKAVGVAVPAEAANSAECRPDPAPAPLPEAAKNTGPGRISTNVTVPKQTQGASFGEKVNQGVQATGGSVAQGAATVGAAVPGGAVISARCSKLPEPEPMTTPESTEK